MGRDAVGDGADRTVDDAATGTAVGGPSAGAENRRDRPGDEESDHAPVAPDHVAGPAGRPSAATSRRSGLRARLRAATAPRVFRTAKLLADGVTQSAVRVHEQTGIANLGRGSSNAILSFHAVGPPSPGGTAERVSPARFRQVVERVGADAEFVPLSAVTTPSRRQRVAVTFDDGHRSVCEHAMPVLRELGVPATVFLNPGLLDDRAPARFAARHDVASGEGRVLTDAQVAELVADPLVSIGNHTMTHPDLTAIRDQAGRRTEIVESRRRLEDRYGADVTAFAYPYGAHDARSRDLVEQTHDLSVTASPRLVGGRAGPHQLPRLDGTAPLSKLSWELTPASDLLHALREPWKDTSAGPGRC